MISEIPPTNDIPLTEDDDAYDETEGENEAPVRETDDMTELPEEMEYDDEDDLPHLEDDDADEDPAAPEPIPYDEAKKDYDDKMAALLQFFGDARQY